MTSLLYKFLQQSAETSPHKEALTIGNQSMDFQTIERQSDRIRDYLRINGIQKGDRVAILLGNTADVVVAFWGILKAGAVAVPIGAELTGEKVQYILNDCTASALFTRMEIIEKSSLKLHETFLKKVIISDENVPSSVDQTLFNTIKKAITAVHNESIQEPISVDLCAIIYTSGSTGEPKGVMLTHENMVTATRSLNGYLNYNASDRILCALPLTFDYGLYQMIMSISVGATLCLEREFTWPIFLLKRIIDQKITIFPIVPTMLMMVYEQAKKKALDLSSVRAITNTGAALTLSNIEMSKKLFPGAEIFSMYGLTECKRCTYLPPKDIDSKPNSVGIAIPNTELWLIDDEGVKITEANQIGQLVIRGATVMRGYWNKPKKTAEKLKDGPIAGEKVLHTGDYCSLDEEGYLYFKGRMDSMIKSRGIKVSPKEVEDFIHKIPEVNSCVITGVPNDQYGETLFAFVKLNEGKSIDEKNILQLCHDGLEAYKVPSNVHFISEMPRTPNGKFNILKLKNEALEMVGARMKISNV